MDFASQITDNNIIWLNLRNHTTIFNFLDIVVEPKINAFVCLSDPDVVKTDHKKLDHFICCYTVVDVSVINL